MNALIDFLFKTDFWLTQSPPRVSTKVLNLFKMFQTSLNFSLVYSVRCKKNVLQIVSCSFSFEPVGKR